MQSIARTVKFANVASVLVTAGEVSVPKLYEKYNIAHYKEAKGMPRELLLEEIPNHDALYCLLRDKIDKEVLSLGKKLKVIATMSVGFDHIDIEECKKRNIVVTITPDVLTETTAETTIALLLATARRLPEATEQVHTGGWGTWSPFYMCGVGIHRSTVGIIGMGRIGASVANKLKTFHPMRIIFSDINYNAHYDAKTTGMEHVDLHDLLTQSDFIILTCLATKQNKDMINKETLGKMKKNAIVINTSRGTLVNQDDLYDALSSGKIRAAGLDVTTPEPLPINDRLLKLKNCVILPHIGSATESTRIEMMQLAEYGILTVLDGQQIPKNIRAA